MALPTVQGAPVRRIIEELADGAVHGHHSR